MNNPSIDIVEVDGDKKADNPGINTANEYGEVNNSSKDIADADKTDDPDINISGKDKDRVNNLGKIIADAKKAVNSSIDIVDANEVHDLHIDTADIKEDRRVNNLNTKITNIVED